MAFFNVHLQDLAQLLHYTSAASVKNSTTAVATTTASIASTATVVATGVTSAAAAAAATQQRFDSSNEIVYESFPASELFSPSRAERSFFVMSVATLFVLSMCGNILTIFVNLRRKIRPFFRICLISLANSDLLTTFFFSTTYMGQFTADFVQVWGFSETMCHLVPFITTSAIMVSSLTLLGIAADRFYAVRATTAGLWNPTCSFCFLCLLLIWATSITISSPIYFIFELVQVYIVDDTIDSGNSTNNNDDGGVPPKLVTMCVSNQEKVGMFYLVVFLVIFMPCIIAFLWLNIIIARTIWQRRRPISANTTANTSTTKTTTTATSTSTTTNTNSRNSVQLLGVNCGATTTNETTTTTTEPATTPSPTQPPANSGSSSQKTRSARELRHIRLFVIIILMMLVFLICRLPAWVLLMLRMYGAHMDETRWRLYFYFGQMHLASCMLNPLFYTFLSETIEYARLVKLKVFNTACGLRLCCERTRTARRHMKVPPMPTAIYGGVDDERAVLPPERVAHVGRCQLFCQRLCCRHTKLSLATPPINADKRNKRQSLEASGERDEGVDMRSTSGDDGSIVAAGVVATAAIVERRKCSQQVYTIYNCSAACTPDVKRAL